MNGKIEHGKTGNKVERTETTAKSNGFRGKNVLLAAGLGLALGAGCGGSSSPSKTTDAGVTCSVVNDDAGVPTCTPTNACEFALVSTGPGDAGPQTAKCVPKKPGIDASPIDTTASEAATGLDSEESADGGAPIDTAPAPVDSAVPDTKPAGVDSAAKDAGPSCTVVKKDAVHVNLGSKWKVGGYPCDKNNSQSRLDDGSTVQRRTETGDDETCAVSANAAKKRVTVTCDTGTYSAGTGGCTVTSAGVTSVCSDTEAIAVTGSTTVPSGTGSRAVVKVASAQSGIFQQVFLQNDGGALAGAAVATKNLNPAGTPTTATIALIGNVGDDGKAVLGGTVTGPTGTTTTCGTPVGATPVAIGDVGASNAASQSNVRVGDVFTADVTAGSVDFNNLAENGPIVNFSGIATYYKGTVVNGASGAVSLVDKATGEPCTILVDQDSVTACGKKFNGQSVTVTATYQKSACAKADAGTQDSAAAATASDAPAAATPEVVPEVTPATSVDAD
jgi:hypothetical protein